MEAETARDRSDQQGSELSAVSPCGSPLVGVQEASLKPDASEQAESCN